ncbi:MAG: phosphoglycerate kinase, partial [Nitrospinota bacterium]|nr:phosphoglycerate kinase [Nitrospinota bacterium]
MTPHSGWKTLADLDLSGRLAFVRCDFNVPLDEERRITDDTRMRATLPTLERLRSSGARTILVSHLGRPKGVRNPAYGLAPIAEHLAGILGQDVPLAPDCVGPEAAALARDIQPGAFLMLENLRFHSGEEENDEEFARALASPADVYVNDAFGTAHRAHASTEGVTRFLPSVAGLLMARELEMLGKALGSPERPFAAIMGGGKVSDKIAVMENLADKVNTL